MTNLPSLPPLPASGSTPPMGSLPVDYRVRQRDYLLDISRAMTSQLTLEKVLNLILKAAASMLDGVVGMVGLHEPDEKFRVRAAFGVEAAQISIFEPMMDNVVGADGRGLNQEAVNSRARQIRDQLATIDIHVRQVIAMPMFIREEMVGAIFIFRSERGQAHEDDVSILQSFADQAAIAVHNASLYQSISDEQQRLAAILEHSADGIMILDSLNRVRRFNKALGRITGWQPSEAIGEFHDTVIKWVRLEEGIPLTQAIRDGHLTEGTDALYAEGDLVRPDGTRISVAITYAPLSDETGELHNIIANVRDITHFRKAREMQSTFVSVVSHELKTPVALIKGYASTLRRPDAKWDNKTILDSLQVIEEESDRLNELIDNLLTASKLQVNEFKLNNVGDVNLEQVAQRNMARFSMNNPNHQLSVQFVPAFPCVQGDEQRLRQVFDNLISNAIKYSPKGGPVRVIGTFDADYVYVAIHDQGIGLPRDEQDRIFQRFYRVDDALSRQTQGTGLGLYLSKALIEAHGGTITVESQPEKGSTFTIRLPNTGC